MSLFQLNTMTFDGSVRLWAFCLESLCLWLRVDGTGEVERRAEDSGRAEFSLPSLSWRHLSKHPAVKLWCEPR